MFHFYSRILFVFGVILGALVAVLFISFKEKSTPNRDYHKNDPSLFSRYEKWFKNQNIQRAFTSMDSLRYSGRNYLTEAEFLRNLVQIKCLVMVRDATLVEKINATWATSCSGLEFLNITKSKRIQPALKKTYVSTWSVLCNALVGSQGSNWVLVVYDSTFVLLENLRYLLAPLEFRKRYYLGHSIFYWNINYNVAQAGIVLSMGAVDALRNVSQVCGASTTFRNQEDYYLGKMLSSLGVYPADTRDAKGLSTFHGFNLQKLFFPGSTILSNYYKFSTFPVRCCSRLSITLEVYGDALYTYNYLLNTLQLFKTGNMGNTVRNVDTGEEKSILKRNLDELKWNGSEISAQEYYRLWQEQVNDPEVFARHLSKPNFDRD